MESLSAGVLLSRAPLKFYYVPNGRIDTYSEMNLSFECGCGRHHNVNDCAAIVWEPLPNKSIYVCPTDYKIFNLIGVKGLLKIKRLKNLGYFKATGNMDVNSFLGELESRKRLD